MHIQSTNHITFSSNLPLCSAGVGLSSRRGQLSVAVMLGLVVEVYRLYTVCDSVFINWVCLVFDLIGCHEMVLSLMNTA